MEISPGRPLLVLPRRLDCYRAGGNICYADTPQSMNREHCVFGASRCVAVNPSDTAGALVALDASMVVLGRGGEKVVKAEEFFIGPAVDITRMTVLRPGEMLTAIRLPAEWAARTTTSRRRVIGRAGTSRWCRWRPR